MTDQQQSVPTTKKKAAKKEKADEFEQSRIFIDMKSEGMKSSLCKVRDAMNEIMPGLNPSVQQVMSWAIQRAIDTFDKNE